VEKFPSHTRHLQRSQLPREQRLTYSKERHVVGPTAWSRAFLAKMTVVQTFKNFSTSYTSLPHPLVHIEKQSNPIHTVPSYLRSILILSTYQCLFVAFPPINAPIFAPSHCPRLDYSNYTWRRVEIMKLLIMQFSLPSRHFIPLRSKYPPQHPVLKHSQSMFLP
jgi:hypothetical protein